MKLPSTTIQCYVRLENETSFFLDEDNNPNLRQGNEVTSS